MYVVIHWKTGSSTLQREKQVIIGAEEKVCTALGMLLILLHDTLQHVESVQDISALRCILLILLFPML